MMSSHCSRSKRSRFVVVLGTTLVAAAGCTGAPSDPNTSPGSSRNTSLVSFASPSTAWEAADLASGITRGDDRRVVQLSGLVRQHADDPAFASAFLTGLGADRLLRLATITVQGDGKDIADLQQGLGRVLARGTQKPGEQRQVSTAWVKDLTDQGRQHWSFHPDPTVEQWTEHGRPALENFNFQVYGYQALGVLLRTGTHSAAFLASIGNGMLAADRDIADDDGVEAWPHQAWDRTGIALAPGGDADTWDPAVGLLIAAGRDTHTAQAFLTAESTGPKGTVSERYGHVDYLVTDRKWGTDDTGINTLGHALRNATATAEPTSLNIVESIVREISLDDNTCKDTFENSQTIHPDLRPHLGHVYTRHMNSVIDSQGAVDSKDDPENVAGLDEDQTTELLTELGKDRATRKMLMNAIYDHALTLYENAYTNKTGEKRASSLTNYSGSFAHIVSALLIGAETDAEQRHIERTGTSRIDPNQSLRPIYDWAAAALNTKDITSNTSSTPHGTTPKTLESPGAKILESLSKKYHRQGTDLVEYLAGQRSSNDHDAIIAILKTIFVHHTPTSDLLATGVIDKKTKQVFPIYEWQDGVEVAWTDRYRSRPNASQTWDAMDTEFFQESISQDDIWPGTRRQCR
jgi:hypothetical protein